MGRGLHTVPLCALPRHASVGSREQVQPPLPPPRRPPGSGGAEGRARGSPAGGGAGGGGGECGGPLAPWRCLLTAGGGGRHGSPGPGGQPSAGGSRPSPAPLYLEPDPRAGPRWGPSSPRPLSRGTGRPGAAVRVSGQWLAGCGAAGSLPCSLSPYSLPREVARSHASRRTMGGAWVGGPGSSPHSRASAVWAITCAAACVLPMKGVAPHTTPVRAHPASLCGFPVRRRGPACSSRPQCEPVAGAGGRVTLRLPSRAGGAHPPCLGGWGPGPPRLAGWWGGGGGAGVSRRGLPVLVPGGGLRYSFPARSVSPARSLPARACGRR